MITDRVQLSYPDGKTNIDWFSVELTTPMAVNSGYEPSRLLIMLRDKTSCLVHDTHIECLVRLIPTGADPRLEKDLSLYPYYGLIIINGNDYEYNLKAKGVGTTMSNKITDMNHG